MAVLNSIISAQSSLLYFSDDVVEENRFTLVFEELGRFYLGCCGASVVVVIVIFIDVVLCCCCKLNDFQLWLFNYSSCC